VVAVKLKKPLVIEEFGLPRDHHGYTLDETTHYRDTYYTNILQYILKSSKDGSCLAGCNFWAWGGFGRPAHIHWMKQDDYLGDPPQEEQGLNSVFDRDSTISIIQNYAFKIMESTK
jgi:mannan endo-1,4-beta-mannosidase